MKEAHRNMEDLHVQEKQNGWEYGRIRELENALTEERERGAEKDERIKDLEKELEYFSDLKKRRAKVEKLYMDTASWKEWQFCRKKLIEADIEAQEDAISGLLNETNAIIDAVKAELQAYGEMVVNREREIAGKNF